MPISIWLSEKATLLAPALFKDNPVDKSNIEGVQSKSQAICEQEEEKSEESFSFKERSINLGNDLYQALYAAATETNRNPDGPENRIKEVSIRDEGIQGNVFGETPEKLSPKRLVYSSLTPLGQFAGTFIVCSGEEYLYIIDQHAAAERVLYEKIAKEAEENPGVSSMLAIPVGLELSYQEYLQLTDAIVKLREYGFILEHFGENSFVIRGVPIWYTGNDPEQLLRLVLAEISDNSLNIIQIRKEALFMAACRQAIKANRYLTAADISALFSDLDTCINSSTCPHGRPLAIRISRAEIYKRFLRQQHIIYQG